MLAQLSTVDDPQTREAMGRCFCLIAASDGVLRPAEREVLGQLLNAIGQGHQLEATEDLCARYRREEGSLGQAMGAVSDAVGNAASNATEAVGSAIGWMKDKLRNPQKSDLEIQQVDFKADTAELHAQQLLKKMAELDLQLASGEISMEIYQERWGQLKTQGLDSDKSN